MKRERIECSAMGCTRYRTCDIPPGQRIVYLCRDHWMMIPKQKRRAMNRAFRRIRVEANIRDLRCAGRLWDWCVRHVDRNFGL